MPTSISTLAALLTQRVVDDLTNLINHTSEEQLHWKPAESARSIFDQVKECSVVNLCWAINIRERGCAVGREVPRELIIFMAGLQDTKASCLDALAHSAAPLIAAINGVADEETDDAINIDDVQGGTMTLAESCLYAYWNMVYHEGQINYIQALYGDQTHYHTYHVTPQSP